MRPPVDVGVHRAPRCEPVVSLVRSRRAPPVPLIVLPKSCSCRWGPCPRPIPRLACLFSFFSFSCRPPIPLARTSAGLARNALLLLAVRSVHISYTYCTSDKMLSHIVLTYCIIPVFVYRFCFLQVAAASWILRRRVPFAFLGGCK